MSLAAFIKIVYLHIQHRRLANMLYKEHVTPLASPVMPAFAATADEIRGQVEGPTSLLPTPAQQDFKLPELSFPTNLEAGNHARPSTAKSVQSMASSLHHRRAFSMSPVSEVITAIFRDNEEQLLESDAVSNASSEDSDTGSWMSPALGRPKPLTAIESGFTEPCGSRWQELDQPMSTAAPKFANAFRGIWRLFLFQGCVEF